MHNTKYILYYDVQLSIEIFDDMAIMQNKKEFHTLRIIQLQRYNFATIGLYL
jgi:hypothetical protein